MAFLLKMKALAFVSLVTLFVSCGSANKIVSNLDVAIENDESDTLVTMVADLSIGNIALADVSLPVFLPKSGQEIGFVSMYTGLGGVKKFELELSLQSIARLEATIEDLPNGTSIPLIGKNRVIAIPVKDQATIYIAIGDGVLAVGASLNLRGLDSVGSKTGTAGVFPVFNINNVIGSAGIYTSREQGENGFALVADLSSMVNTGSLLGRKTASFDEEEIVLDYQSLGTSKRKKRKMDRALYKMHKKEATI